MAAYGKSMVVFTHQVISVGRTVHWPRLCIEDRYNLCCDISNVVPELQETESSVEVRVARTHHGTATETASLYVP